MSPETSLTSSQIVVQVCLFLVAAIAIFGGGLQMYLGQPNTSPRLDNVHRFMAGVYLSTGFINLWAAITDPPTGTLIYLLALGVLMAGCGRLLSIRKVGLPQPAGVWLGYLVPELVLPFVIAGAHYAEPEFPKQSVVLPRNRADLRAPRRSGILGGLERSSLHARSSSPGVRMGCHRRGVSCGGVRRRHPLERDERSGRRGRARPRRECGLRRR